MDIKEPEITKNEIISLDDPDFCKFNICIVAGCGTGIGRAVSIAAAANGMTVMGIDINAKEGELTCQKANAFDGQMVFRQTDLTDDDTVKAAVDQAEQRGITAEEVVRDVMMGKSRVKEMMSPVEVANLFIHGCSRFSKYLVGGDLLFDGGMFLTY